MAVSRVDLSCCSLCTYAEGRNQKFLNGPSGRNLSRILLFFTIKAAPTGVLKFFFINREYPSLQSIIFVMRTAQPIEAIITMKEATVSTPNDNQYVIRHLRLQLRRQGPTFGPCPKAPKCSDH